MSKLPRQMRPRRTLYRCIRLSSLRYVHPRHRCPHEQKSFRFGWQRHVVLGPNAVVTAYVLSLSLGNTMAAVNANRRSTMDETGSTVQ